MSGGSNTVSLNALLKKTEHYDKDERYMATSDLCEALKRHAAASSSSSGASPQSGVSSGTYNQQVSQQAQLIDTATERRICTAVLVLLDDSSNDVQAIAVKTLGVLLTTVHEEQVVEIADRLCTLVLDSSKSELRDVYAIGLRTLVKTVPASMGDVVSHRLVGRLIDGVRSNSSSTFTSASSANESDDKSAEEIALACLDVLTDLLTRFGSTSLSITRQHEQILNTALGQLASDRRVVRKRAGNAVGCLSVVVSDNLLFRLVESLLGQIDSAEGVGRSGRRRTRQAHLRDPSGLGTRSTSEELKAADTGGLIRTMCTVSGAVGHRLGQAQIDRIVPIFLRFCDPDDAVTGDDDNAESSDEDMDGSGEEAEEDEVALEHANELRESCFAGFESFVLRCPNEIGPHLKSIIHASLAYMQFDPNYSYGDDDDNQDGNGSDEDEEEYDDDDDEEEEFSDEDLEDDMSDDDDDSWKVRRSAIRALTAVVEATKSNPSTLWIDGYTLSKGSSKKTMTVAAALVGRFKEREENCRVDVIDCFARLLSITVSAAGAGVVVLTPPDAMDTSSSVTAEGQQAPVAIDLSTKYVPAIVKACEKQLSTKKGGERSKSSALALLSTLCLAPGGMGNQTQIDSVFAHVRSILSSGNLVVDDGLAHRQSSGMSKSLKLDALCLVRITLSCGKHDSNHVKDSLIKTLLPELCRSVKEDWYKVIAEALRVLSEIPPLLWLCNDRKQERKDEVEMVANQLYEAIEPRLAAHDLDQEIKECALGACASLLSNLHDSLTPSPERKDRLLYLLLERLRNETTRVSAIKALSAISSAENNATNRGAKLDLGPILSDAVLELASLLRQQSRGLKQSALEALDVVVTNHGSDSSSIDSELYEKVLAELGAIIVDSDLHISHLSLRASISILKVCPSCGPFVKAHILPSALALSTSPLLQDLALASLLSLLEQLVVLDAIAFDELLNSLQSRVAVSEDRHTSLSAPGHGSGSGGKQGLCNLAKCVATITASTTPSNRETVISNLLTDLESDGAFTNESAVRTTQLSLLTSGDIGRLVNLSDSEGVAERLEKSYLEAFDSPSEEIKHASSYALGRAAVGSMGIFLPAILDALEQNKQKRQYLLLSSLRELINCHKDDKGKDISESVPLILPHLINHCADREEGVRMMVSECFGSLACLQPSEILPRLSELVDAHSGNKFVGEETDVSKSNKAKKDALVCWTMATSVKFAIAGKVDPSQLSPFMPTFLTLLQEEDLAVKNTGLLMVYSAVHHMPHLVAGLMKDHILPSLYELAQLNLKRVVDLGPFKHTVDDALPLRKAALSIFSTCLENCPSSLDIPAFMPILAKALEDVEDVQLQCHQIVINMCHHHPNPLVGVVESFVDPLEKTLHKKKGQKTGTELERLNEWIKSALRTVVALSRLDGSMNCRKFADFVDRTRKNTKFQPILEVLDEEL